MKDFSIKLSDTEQTSKGLIASWGIYLNNDIVAHIHVSKSNKYKGSLIMEESNGKLRSEVLDFLLVCPDLPNWINAIV